MPDVSGVAPTAAATLPAALPSFFAAYWTSALMSVYAISFMNTTVKRPVLPDLLALRMELS